MGSKDKKESPGGAVKNESFVPQRPVRYRVCKGKSVTVPCKGIKNEGDDIKAEWFDPEGQKSLDALIARGYVETYK
jgi:hypothetical protein